MTEKDSAKLQLLMLKGAITELPKVDQEEIQKRVNELKGKLKEWGDAGFMAFSIVVCEMAIED